MTHEQLNLILDDNVNSFLFNFVLTLLIALLFFFLGIFWPRIRDIIKFERRKFIKLFSSDIRDVSNIYLVSDSLYIRPEFWLWIGFRILFPYQMMRYYQGKTTRKRTLVLGVYTELLEVPLTIFEAIFVALIYRMWSGIYILSRFPIPLLLIVGIWLIRFFPAPSKQDWDLEGETRKWWLENGPSSQ